MQPASFTVLRTWPDPERNYWHALVRSGTATVEFDTRYGSWQTPPLDLEGRRREALPSLAATLQREVRARAPSTGRR